MADFTQTVEYFLSQEGGYSAHNDKTGDPETNFGVTIDVARAYGYLGDMHDLPRETAIEIYKEKYWPGLDGIKEQAIVTAVFTYRGNMGPSTGIQLLQRALNSLGCDLDEDGDIGPLTLDAVNTADAPSVMQALVQEAIGFYQDLVSRKPEKQPYLQGWINRSMKILQLPTAQAGIAGGMGGLMVGLLLFMMLKNK